MLRGGNGDDQFRAAVRCGVADACNVAAVGDRVGVLPGQVGGKPGEVGSDPTLSEAPALIVTEPRDELPLPIAIEPLPMLNAVFPFVVRLSAASLASVEWVIVPLPVRLMTALSDAVGTTPPTQLPGLSQSPPVGAAVVFLMIVDRTNRSSRLSINGLRLMAHLRSTERRCREVDLSMSGRRFEHSLGFA